MSTIMMEDNKELQENRQLVESIFGYDTYKSMMDFGRKIKEENANLIILIARKAVFFHKILKNIGFDFSPAQIVSDRIIDFEDDFFVDKKIIVVDDSTILGTTAKKIVAKLQKKAANVKFYTFAADMNYLLDNVQIDYIQRKYGRKNEKAKKRDIQSSNELLSFCFNEIKYVSTLSIPYLIDFPVSETYKCSQAEWKQIKEILEQNFRKTDLPVHSDYYDVGAFSYYPNEELKNKLRVEVGNQFYEKFIECGKIRLYVQYLGSGELSLKVVPLFLFRPFTNEDSDTLFNAIIGTDKEKFKVLQDKKACYRFVQYYLSYCLGTFLLQSCDLKEKLFKSCDKETKNVTFGEQISDAIWHLKFQLSQLQTLPLNPQENYDYDTFKNIFDNLDNTQDAINDEISFEKSFANIFKTLFEKEEIPIREKRGEETKRLEHGFSLELLYDYFKNTTYFLNNETFDGFTHFEKISDLLDKYNDSGVSVPIICKTKDGTACYRAYRHGELALLTEKNLSLYYHFLSRFFEKKDDEESQFLPDFILEKISILFFYFGTLKYFGNIKETLMKRYDAEDKYINKEGKPYDCVNIGFFRHGAILTNEKKGDKALSTPTDYKSKTWFYNKDKCPKFLQAITLENNDGKIKFIFNKNYEPYPNISLSRGEIAGARKIASVLKQIKQQEKYKDFCNIITVLATCPNVESLALAIISLIKIVEKNMDKLFTDLSFIQKKEERYKKLINSPVYEAINSSYMKYRAGKDFFSYCQDLLKNEKYNDAIYDDVKDFIEKYAEGEDSGTTSGEILCSLKSILEKFAYIINYLNFLRIYFKSTLKNIDQEELDFLHKHNANWAKVLDKDEKLTNINEIEKLLSNITTKQEDNLRIKDNIQNKVNEYLESVLEETKKLEQISKIKNYLGKMDIYEKL